MFPKSFEKPRRAGALLGLLAICTVSATSATREPQTNRDRRMRPAAGMAVSRAAAMRMTGVVTAELVNKVGPSYKLVSISCELDGVQVCAKSGKLGERTSLFNRRVSAGNHRWSIVAVYQASGGVFSYTSGIRYFVRNGGEITVDVDRQNRTSILVYEGGDSTVPLAQRLRMAIKTEVAR